MEGTRSLKLWEMAWTCLSMQNYYVHMYLLIYVLYVHNNQFDGQVVDGHL